MDKKYFINYMPWAFRTKSNCSGFTLMEILVVLSILGLLASIAIPRYQRSLEKARIASCASEIKSIATAAIQYKMEHGEWPKKSPKHGVGPPELEPYLSGFDWSKTGIGGKLFWALLPVERIVGVGINNNIDIEMARRLDAFIDDGNLSTGTFKKNRKRYLYILEKY